ncbi:MAG: C-GCAxxG-C-C family protein [Treponemataceae bacterium]
MTKGDSAVAKFKDGYNCAQSVLYSFTDDLGLDKNVALKIANAFGGGMGRKQEVCGAVSGALMVLGMTYGRAEGDGKEKQDTTYAKTRELIDAFTAECGTIKCRELLSGCNLLTAEGQAEFKEKHLIDECHKCVRVSCGILEKLL